MSVDNKERIFLVGGTGNVGRPLVRELLAKGIPVTLYTRTSDRAKALFRDLSSPLLTIVQGDYQELTTFEQAIKGHQRLFLLVDDLAHMASIVGNIASKAFGVGIQQIVHVSSAIAAERWRSTSVAVQHYLAEDAIFQLVTKQHQDKHYVTLRPQRFMSNLKNDIPSIIKQQVIIDTVPSHQQQGWISPNDLARIAAQVLQDPIQKHANAVYDIVGDSLTLEERADACSKVLQLPVTYKQTTPENKYKMLTQYAPHVIAYELSTFQGFVNENISPGLSILLDREPERLDAWLLANKSLFQ
ncbi:NAD(P)-binding protein [Lichtheimia hyalospora FSU 10163]|nr:NAD(P)-binding protein [Lichtheimia hyalospora FSU 10163]